MTQQHPITPPPELVLQWSIEAEQNHQPTVAYSLVTALATRAAQWGADTELQACCEWLRKELYALAADGICAARRPKPPSLKEQALLQLDGIAAVFSMSHGGDLVCDKIRHALEALPND
jgi:hypothetical protein